MNTTTDRAPLLDRAMAHLRAYPDRSFTAFELSRVLGGGCVTKLRNSLTEQADQGHLTRTDEAGPGRPSRVTFQAVA